MKPFAVRANLTLRELEQLYILRVLRDNNWHRQRTADALGIDQKTLRNKLRAWGISHRALTSIPPELHEEYSRRVLELSPEDVLFSHSTSPRRGRS